MLSAPQSIFPQVSLSRIEVFALAGVATVLRDGRNVATTPIAGLDRRQLVNQMVGTEFDEVHRAAAALPHADHDAILRVDGLAAGALKSFSLRARPGEVALSSTMSRSRLTRGTEETSKAERLNDR